MALWRLLDSAKSHSSNIFSFLERNFTVKHKVNSESRILLDYDLEIEFNKPVKVPSEFIGYTQKKEIVLKWNIIRYINLQFANFLYDICYLEDNGQYSLHHEDIVNEGNEFYVTQLVNYIAQRGNTKITIYKISQLDPNLTKKLCTFY